MKSTGNRRHFARTASVLALYELDSTGHEIPLVLDAYLNMDFEANDARTMAYAAFCAFELGEDYDDEAPPPGAPLGTTAIKMMHRLVKGVSVHRDEIDDLITEHAPEWPADQIAVIDRTILRVAIYEVVYEDISNKVAINEAIEISKVFGTDSSPRFINGVLGAILRTVQSRDDEEEFQV